MSFPVHVTSAFKIVVSLCRKIILPLVWDIIYLYATWSFEGWWLSDFGHGIHFACIWDQAILRPIWYSYYYCFHVLFSAPFFLLVFHIWNRWRKLENGLIFLSESLSFLNKAENLEAFHDGFLARVRFSKTKFSTKCAFVPFFLVFPVFRQSKWIIL